MNEETFKAIIETRDIEVKHTLETRQIAFDRDRALMAGIATLVRVLHLNGTINAEEANLVLETMSYQEGEKQ